jgi:hypothetical protein
LSTGQAVKLLERFDNPEQYLLAAAHVAEGKGPGHKVLAKLPARVRLAVEMAAHEENERIAMEGDLVLLELDWKEAEEIAAIADSLLIPAEVEEQLEELRRGDKPRFYPRRSGRRPALRRPRCGAQGRRARRATGHAPQLRAAHPRAGA